MHFPSKVSCLITLWRTKSLKAITMLIDKRLKTEILKDGYVHLPVTHGSFASASRFPNEYELVINMFHIHNAIKMHI